MVISAILLVFGFLIAVLTKNQIVEEIYEFKDIFIKIFSVFLVILSLLKIPYTIPVLFILVFYKKREVFVYSSLVLVIMYSVLFSSDLLFIVSLSICILAGWLSNINFSKNVSRKWA